MAFTNSFLIIIYTISCLLLCCLVTQAQTQFGLKTGINFSKINLGSGLNFFSDFDYTFDRGLHSGFLLAFPLKKHAKNSETNPFSYQLFLQTELNFTQKGVRLRFNNSALNNGNVSYRMSYLSLPVLLKLQLGKVNTRWQTYILSGLAINHWLGASRIFRSDNGTTREGLLIGENQNRWELAAQFGLGQQFLLKKKGALFIETRFALGLTPLDKTLLEGEKAINKVWGIYLGWVKGM